MGPPTKQNRQVRSETKARMKPYDVFLPLIQKSKRKHRRPAGQTDKQTDRQCDVVTRQTGRQDRTGQEIQNRQKDRRAKGAQGQTPAKKG